MFTQLKRVFLVSVYNFIILLKNVSDLQLSNHQTQPPKYRSISSQPAYCVNTHYYDSIAPCKVSSSSVQACYFERSVVALKLCKEYLNSDIQYANLTPDKIKDSLAYRTLFYVNIYGSYKLSKNSPVVLAQPVHIIYLPVLC